MFLFVCLFCVEEHVLSCDECGPLCGTDRVKSSLAVCGVWTQQMKTDVDLEGVV